MTSPRVFGRAMRHGNHMRGIAGNLAAIVSFGGMLMASTAVAQTPADALPDGLLDCADEPDALARLACYDREIAGVDRSPASDVTEGANNVPVPGEDRVDFPGASGVTAPEPAPPRRGSAAVAETQPAREAAASAPEKAPVSPASQDNERHESEADEFSARVVDIKRRPRGEMIILLDNEQVWEQKHSGTRFRLNVGDTATVKKSAFGSYRLFGKGNRSIQVERIQ